MGQTDADADVEKQDRQVRALVRGRDEHSAAGAGSSYRSKCCTGSKLNPGLSFPMSLSSLALLFSVPFLALHLFALTL